VGTAGAHSEMRGIARLTAAVIAAAALTVSCATQPSPAPVSTATAQAAIAQQRDAEDAVASYITAQLNADPLYYYRHVNVRVDQGTAILTGYVWDTPSIYHARQIARQVPGVTRVVTSGLELEINGPNHGPAR
jgi:osmotically-inducible protein OsmY